MLWNSSMWNMCEFYFPVVNWKSVLLFFFFFAMKVSTCIEAFFFSFSGIDYIFYFALCLVDGSAYFSFFCCLDFFSRNTLNGVMDGYIFFCILSIFYNSLSSSLINDLELIRSWFRIWKKNACILRTPTFIHFNVTATAIFFL